MEPSFVPSWDSTTTLVILILVFVIAFGLLLAAFVSLTRPQVPHVKREEGSPPAVPTIEKPQKQTTPPNAPVAPNDLPWTQTTPKAKRPARSQSQTLPLSVVSASNTLELDTTSFLQKDPNSAGMQPFQTVLIVPTSAPSTFKYIKDRNACTATSTPLTCGLLPDVNFNNELRPEMSDLNLTGPYQICFGIQNRANHAVQFLVDASTTTQFEVPSKKTAFFISQSNFWSVMAQRVQNPSKPLAPQATLLWNGSLVPDQAGAQPNVNTSTQDLAAQAAAAEVEAIQGARFGQKAGSTL